MAGRFHRLEDSEDVGTNQVPTFSTNYYDEPQNDYSSQPHIGLQTQEPADIYSTDDRRRMSYTTRKPIGQLSYPPLGSTSEEPLINQYYDGTPPLGGSMDSKDPSKYTGYDNFPGRLTDIGRKSAPRHFSKTASSIWSRARGNAVSHVSTPLWAAPWRHEPCADLGPSRATTVRYFDRKKQQNRIFFHFFFQWLIPVAFCMALAGTFYFYSSKSQLSRDEKYWFNALNTGFSLCLGFAVVNGMKEYANILRWRLLADRHVTLQQFELLLNIASQKAATRFLWAGRTAGSILPNTNQVLCFVYLFLMLGLQIAIALLGLCQSVETNPNLHSLSPGEIWVTDLSSISLDGNSESVSGVDEFRLQTSAAQTFGIAGSTFYVNASDDSNLNIALATWQGYEISTDNSTKWWYRFTDSCAGPSCSSYYTTNRWVSAVATCREYTIVSGGYNGNSSVTYVDSKGHHIEFPFKGLEYSAATVYYSDTNETCGPRCTTTYALNVGWNPGGDIQGPPQFFACNNTISGVQNTENLANSSAYQLPDEQARLIAGAIGWDGVDYDDDEPTLQTNVYLGQSDFSWSRLNGQRLVAGDMANWIMHFSIAAVAAIDDLGPKKTIPGQSPSSGQYLQVKWVFVIIILVAVPGIQFLVLIGTVIWGNKAVVRDGSFLSTAVLMRPIADRLERSGCALTSDEICDVLGNPKLTYGVKMPSGSSAYGGMAKGSDQLMHLDVVPEDERVNAADMAWHVGMTMPQGRYDGMTAAMADEATGTASGRSIDGPETRMRKRRLSL